MFKILFGGLIFGGGFFSEQLIIGWNFAFQNGMGLTIKSATPNSPWAYIWEGLLSEGYSVRLTFGGRVGGGEGGGGVGGFIFVRAYFLEALIIGILRYMLLSRVKKNKQTNRTQNTNKNSGFCTAA